MSCAACRRVSAPRRDGRRPAAGTPRSLGQPFAQSLARLSNLSGRAFAGRTGRCHTEETAGRLYPSTRTRRVCGHWGTLRQLTLLSPGLGRLVLRQSDCAPGSLPPFLFILNRLQPAMLALAQTWAHYFAGITSYLSHRADCAANTCPPCILLTCVRALCGEKHHSSPNGNDSKN